MRIGIIHPAVGEEELEDVFARSAEAGADGVEIHYASAATALALNDPLHADRLAAAATESGLAISSLCLHCLAATPSLIGRPEVIQSGQQVILRALGCAAQAGAKIVTIPFFGKNTIEVEEELNRAADALLELVDQAEEVGVVLAVETSLAFHQQQFLLDHLGNTGFVQVSCNPAVALARKLDMPTGIRQLGAGAIAQVRIKDVRLVNGGGPPDFDVPLGQGNVDFRAVAQALRAVAYDGWAIAEPPVTVQTARDPLANARQAVTFTKALFEAAGA
jgi:sugar phosphate isomerase/epimerase